MSTLERNAGREMLDARPLAAAVRRDAAAELARLPRERQPQDRGVATLAAIIGFDEKSLRRILDPRRTSVSLDLADRYCCATDRLLAEMYPEVYEFDPPDPDVTFEWACKTCLLTQPMLIVYEARLRMYLRCPECDRGHYVLRNKRTIPPAFIEAGKANLAAGRQVRMRVKADRERVLQMWEAGLTATQIAEEVGVRPATINTIRWREGWRKRKCGQQEWA